MTIIVKTQRIIELTEKHMIIENEEYEIHNEKDFQKAIKYFEDKQIAYVAKAYI